MASVRSNTYEGRYLELKVEEISYSIEGNYSVVRRTLSVVGGIENNYDVSPVKAVVNGETFYETQYVTTWDSYKFPAVKGSVSDEVTIYHNADGKKSISFSLSGRVWYHTPVTNSGTLKLTDIPRAAKISATDTMLGDDCVISISKALEDYSVSVSWEIGRESGTILEKSKDASVIWVPDESLAYEFPDSPTGSCILTAVTYNGDTIVGTETKAINLIPPITMVPTVGALLAERVAGVVPADWGVYVQKKSKVMLTAQNAQGAYGSQIVKYEISGDGSSWEGSSITTGFIGGKGNITYKCTVTDSRGRTGSAEVSIYVEAYSPPSIGFYTAFRCTQDGTAADDGAWLYGRAQADFSQIGNNSASLKIGLYSADGSLIEESQMQSGEVCVIGGSMAGQYSYRAVITATDSLGEKDEVTEIIPSEDVAFTMMPGGKGAAFGKYAEKEKVLELPEDWALHFGDISILLKIYPVGAVCMRSDSTNPGTVFGGTWAEITQTAVSGVKLWKRTA